MTACAFVAALGCSVTAVAASAGGTPRELFRNAFLAPAGHVANLTSGVTYKASDFPLPIRVTIPEGTWGGALRIMALGVHGKTVLVYVENGELPAAQFPDFLDQADTLLKTLRFAP